jgi:lipopolysaccharide export system permease protein
MTVLQRYFTSEIVRCVLFALAAFLGLFAFFELISQLESVGYNGYRIQHALLYILMGMPGNIYDLMPTAVLIGSIYALSQFAARSEFTIMRASSLSTGMAIKMLSKIALIFAVVTLLFGEFIAPKSTEWGERIRLSAQGSSLSKQFRSGLWAKDVIKSDGLSGDIIGTRFINIQQMFPNGELQDIKVYELDQNFHLSRLIFAKQGTYKGDYHWQFKDVLVQEFPASDVARSIDAPITHKKLAETTLTSEVTPEILSVLFSEPERMSAVELYTYTQHLELNKQKTDRYDIAFWKKVIYPFSIFVMMALALPFAYLHFRSGGVSLKIFAGIMLGVSFQLINTLFSHLGLLNGWNPFIAAALPSLLFLALALFALRWIERH